MKKIIDKRDPSKEAFEEDAISFGDILADQERRDKDGDIVPLENHDKPKFLDDDTIILKEPLTYSRHEELSKQDLEDMKHIFTQDDNEILDVPSMINRVHVEKIEN